MCNRKKKYYFINIYLLIGVLKWPKNISTHLPLLNTTGSINIYEYANLYTPTCWVFWEGHFCNSYLLKYSIAFIFFSPHNIVIVPFSEVLVSTGLSGCSIVLVEERSRSAREPEERPDMNRWVRIGWNESWGGREVKSRGRGAQWSGRGNRRRRDLDPVAWQMSSGARVPFNGLGHSRAA